MWTHGVRGGRWPAGHPGPGAAVAVALVQVLGCRSAAGDLVPAEHLGPLAYALLLTGPVALLARHRAPVPVAAVAMAATLGWVVTGPAVGPFFLALLVALFTAAKAGRPRPAAGVAAAGYAGWLLLGGLFAGSLAGPPTARPTFGTAVGVGAALAVTVALGAAARVRAEHLAEMGKVRAEQARARAEQQRRQSSEERLRVARELHDVLGHHLSLINVQAGVGLHLMDSRPEQARAALTAIKSASAEALREVRSVLGVLRPEEEAAPRQPALGLERLADLTADAGLPVHTRVRGTARPLPPEVDRAAYRIVQEALTNVRRHAGTGAHAVITVGYEERLLRLDVLDGGGTAPAGRTAPGAGTAEGNGIAGMRARAETVGGTLSAGPAPAGGFLVSACLPAPAVPA